MNVRRSKVLTMLAEAGDGGEALDAYKLRLLDSDRYTLADVQQWLAERGVPVGTTIIHRDRKAELERFEGIATRRDMAVRMVQMAQREGWPIARLNVELAGQKIFDALNDMEGISPENGAQVIRLLEATAKLRSAEAKAQLVDLQAEDLKVRFDKAVQAEAAKAAAGGGDGKIGREQIGAIRKAMFGDVA